MERLQAFKFELRPDGEQRRRLTRFAESCRFVFNQQAQAPLVCIPKTSTGVKRLPA
jgi:hypothetical protein